MHFIRLVGAAARCGRVSPRRRGPTRSAEFQPERLSGLEVDGETNR